MERVNVIVCLFLQVLLPALTRTSVIKNKTSTQNKWIKGRVTLWHINHTDFINQIGSMQIASIVVVGLPQFLIDVPESDANGEDETIDQPMPNVPKNPTFPSFLLAPSFQLISKRLSRKQGSIGYHKWIRIRLESTRLNFKEI